MTDAPNAEATRREIERATRVGMLDRLSLKLRADADWFAARGISVSARASLALAQQFEADAHALAANLNTGGAAHDHD